MAASHVEGSRRDGDIGCGRRGMGGCPVRQPSHSSRVDADAMALLCPQTSRKPTDHDIVRPAYPRRTAAPRRSDPTVPAALRSVAAGVCLLVAVLLLPVATAGWWVRDTVVNTPHYVDAVTPWAKDPDVTAAVENRLAGEVMRVVDRLQLVDGSLRPSVEPLVRRGVRQLVDSPAFVPAWRAANEVAHQQVVSVLSGESNDVNVGPDDTVRLRIAALTRSLQARLASAGVPFADQLPEVQASFPITTKARLAKAQKAYALLDRWGAVLPVVVLALIIVGLALARNRPRALTWTAAGAVLGMLLLSVVVAVGRPVALDALPAGTPGAAAGAAYDALTAELKHLVLVIGIVAVLAFAVGLVSGYLVRRGARTA